MKCPVCGLKLHEHSAGSFAVDICRDGCSGIWFDKSEFEKCDEHVEPFPAGLLRVKKIADVVVDRNKARSCPRCTGTTLTRIVLDPERRVEIDRCSGCEGHWLDIGEIELIRNENKERSQIDARITAWEKKAQQALNDPAAANRVKAFLKVIFR